MLFEADANAVKTAGVAITALELDQCFFFYSGAGRLSAFIIIVAALKQSDNTTNVVVKSYVRLHCIIEGQLVARFLPYQEHGAKPAILNWEPALKSWKVAQTVSPTCAPPSNKFILCGKFTSARFL
jgi:hypothetical protein